MLYFKYGRNIKVWFNSRNYYNQSIQMHVTENKLDIAVKLSNQDHKLDDLYNPITNTVTFAIGLISAIIISTLLLFVLQWNTIFLKKYIIYPICCIFLAYLNSGVFASSKYNVPIMSEKIRWI